VVNWTNAARRTVSSVSRVVVDPNFDPATLDNDASLLVLSRPVSSPHIPLWNSGTLNAGTGAWIAGWGDKYAGQASPTTVLQWASTVVQSSAYCSQYNINYDSGTELCAVNYPYDNTATCNGDSGGPVFAKGSNGGLLEIGVTSSGPTDCDTTTADYFTSIYPIEHWVQSWITAVTPKVTSVRFLHWRVHRYGPRYSWWTTVAPGGSLYYCARSTRVTHLEAYYDASGPSSGPDVQSWYRNGTLWGSFHDPHLGSSSYFGIDAPPGYAPIRPGSWVVHIDYQGRLVGSTSIHLVNSC
jgi:hypothetical protein